ncbi:MAG: hypothetical protein IIB69_13895, partial [Proteobacteria bacterium]|nr:hypothetical protein [Pseudomonadota bacterium]
MQKQQPPQDPVKKHSCNETADASPETDKEPTYEELEAAAAEAEAKVMEVADVGNVLLDRLEDI